MQLVLQFFCNSFAYDCTQLLSRRRPHTSWSSHKRAHISAQVPSAVVTTRYDVVFWLEGPFAWATSRTGRAGEDGEEQARCLLAADATAADLHCISPATRCTCGVTFR